MKEKVKSIPLKNKWTIDRSIIADGKNSRVLFHNNSTLVFQAEIFATAQNHFAEQATENKDFWHHLSLAELLRALAKRIESLEEDLRNAK